MYHQLDDSKTIATIETLHKRINDRFPDSGLGRVCAQLCEIARSSQRKSQQMSQPNVPLRFTVAVIILGSLFGLLYTVSTMELSLRTLSLAEFVQVSEAAINDVVLIGAALFFLVSVETRVKRSRVLVALHELRAIAHVIDMHQLTKDPSKIRYASLLQLADNNSTLTLNAHQLTRYLDYCSEMLSLTGKIAALYAQRFPDAVVLAGVNELESLTTGLSRKIWQKIMILHKLEDSVQPRA